MEVIYIQYKGIDHREYVEQNLRASFRRDCGLEITHLMIEPTRNDLVNYLTTREFPRETILHFVGHGFRSENGGLAKLQPGSDDIGDRSTLIPWLQLVELFNGIAYRCPRLYVNLGTVCYSNGITDLNFRLYFDYLITTGTVSNQLIPRKANQQFTQFFQRQRVNYLQLGEPYQFGYRHAFP